MTHLLSAGLRSPVRFLRTILATTLIVLGASDGLSQTRTTGPRSSTFAIDSHVVLLVGSEEPGPVLEAAKDLAGDLEKVLGARPHIANREQDAGSTTIVIGFRSKLTESLRPAGASVPEAFSISIVRPSASTGAKRYLLLTGADMRGTMFAVYQFAEEFLGVDPLYYWTDHEPAKRPRIDLPATLNKAYPAPVFKYRGFFINDEDLLTGWAPGSKDHTGISLDVWNRIYETILRLKGNIVAPGTWIFPDEPQIKLAAKRGLIITQHHAIPLGVNVARWPKDVPYSYSSNPETLENAWRDAVSQYPADAEVLWTVGLRGLSDVSYAAFDPSVRDNNQALGHLISKAIAAQMRIVRERYPKAQFITNLWQEGARLVQQGDLKIPDGVNVVWADDGYGNLQDGGRVAAREGAYYHVAMMNSRANQLTEMVPVKRISDELGRYVRAGATHYMLLNTSDIRPVSMTTKAVMDMAWKGSINDKDDVAFYRQWSADEFGKGAAEKIASIYKDYFQAPAHTSREPVHEYGDQYYHTQSRLLLLSEMVENSLYGIPGQSPTWVTPRVIDFPWVVDSAQRLKLANDEAEHCREAQPRWDALWTRAVAAEQSVTPERRPFYRAHVLAMIAINRESNRILGLAARAVQQAEAGDHAAAKASAEEALDAITQIRKAETAAEYGKWKNWYRGDWLTNVDRTAEMLTAFAKYQADPMSKLLPPILWDGWEAYHHIMDYEGHRSADVK